MSKSGECVKVVVRCRPLSPQEINDNRQIIVQISPQRGEIIITNPNNDAVEPEKTFTFDIVYDWTSKQDQVYSDTAYPIVESVLEGYNGTIFAYGQTGTGKTFTMEGAPDPDHIRGIIPRAFEHIFKHIEGTPNRKFLVRASFLELYNEEICDLLSKNYSKQKLELREKPDAGIYVQGLTHYIIQDTNEMKKKLSDGRKNRHTGETQMNKDSSRSHSIFSIIVEAVEIYPDGSEHFTQGKLNLVDLAGSERQSKTHAIGTRFQEAVHINLSLTTLGNVISSLVDPNKSHIPYRDSKLTRLLQDSLGGNTKTVMISNIGPANYNYEETLSTLRYANRAKSIKNKPKINEDPKDAMIREYQNEIQRLREELQKKLGGKLMIGAGGKQIIEKEVIEKIEDEQQYNELQEKLQKENAQVLDQIHQEKQHIEKQKNLAEDEKKQLLEKLQEKEHYQEKNTEEQKNMIKKFKEMKNKLLQGDKMKEQALLQEKELKQAQLELEEKKQRERRQQEELAQKQAVKIEVEEKYKNIKEEIEKKTEKINTLVTKIQEAKKQKNDIQDMCAREKEILMEENRDLMRELQLLDLIIAHFIPQEDVDKLMKQIEFCEDKDDWQINENYLDKVPVARPCSALNLKKPTSEFARMALSLGDNNPRFRYDNIMQLDLDLPERTTEDFYGQVSQKVQDTINIALNDNIEEDLQILNNELRVNIYVDNTLRVQSPKSPNKSQKKQQPQAQNNQGGQQQQQKKTNSRPTTGSRGQAQQQQQQQQSQQSVQQQSQAEQFPKSKGLIKK